MYELKIMLNPDITQTAQEVSSKPSSPVSPISTAMPAQTPEARTPRQTFDSPERGSAGSVSVTRTPPRVTTGFVSLAQTPDRLSSSGRRPALPDLPLYYPHGPIDVSRITASSCTVPSPEPSSPKDSPPIIAVQAPLISPVIAPVNAVRIIGPDAACSSILSPSVVVPAQLAGTIGGLGSLGSLGSPVSRVAGTSWGNPSLSPRVGGAQSLQRSLSGVDMTSNPRSPVSPILRSPSDVWGSGLLRDSKSPADAEPRSPLSSLTTSITGNHARQLNLRNYQSIFGGTPVVTTFSVEGTPIVSPAAASAPAQLPKPPRPTASCSHFLNSARMVLSPTGRSTRSIITQPSQPNSVAASPNPPAVPTVPIVAPKSSSFCFRLEEQDTRDNTRCIADTAAIPASPRLVISRNR